MFDDRMGKIEMEISVMSQRKRLGSAKKPWQPPKVTRFQAGKAENNFGATPDGTSPGTALS
jgi:hypothetical protein